MLTQGNMKKKVFEDFKDFKDFKDLSTPFPLFP